MNSAGLRTSIDDRSEPRIDVIHRTRLASMDGVERLATVVNVSARGLMVRVDGEYGEGDRVQITLPRVGKVAAQVRWSLGGRIGCRLQRMIGMSDYHQLLQAIRRA